MKSSETLFPDLPPEVFDIPTIDDVDQSLLERTVTEAFTETAALAPKVITPKMRRRHWAKLKTMAREENSNE